MPTSTSSWWSGEREEDPFLLYAAWFSIFCQCFFCVGFLNENLAMCLIFMNAVCFSPRLNSKWDLRRLCKTLGATALPRLVSWSWFSRLEFYFTSATLCKAGVGDKPVCIIMVSLCQLLCCLFFLWTNRLPLLQKRWDTVTVFTCPRLEIRRLWSSNMVRNFQYSILVYLHVIHA